MIEWTHVHPWMTFTVLLVLVSNISLRFVIHLRGINGEDADRNNRECGDGRTTPDRAREYMLAPRQRAAKAIDDAIESFCEDGNPEAVILLPYDDVGDKAMIAELLEYKNAGWSVEFHRDYAAIQLPEVVS